VIFAIDNSGETESLELRKELVKQIIEQNLARDSRVGLSAYGDVVDIHFALQLWTSAGTVKDTLKSIPATIGSEVDTSAMITNALDQFASVSEQERERLLILITDHNPCTTEACPESLCQLAASVKEAGVRIVVIASGEAAAIYIACILEKPADFVYIDSLIQSNFAAITTNIMPVICPFVLERDVKITEIKALRNSLCLACNRFVEIYNNGAAMDASLLQFSGTIEGNAPSGITVEANQYVVFYDAANDERVPAAITCRLCQDTNCDLSACSESQIICRCGNALYIPCGNTVDGDDAFTCSFQDSASNTAFHVVVADALSGEILDEVKWTEHSWIIIQDGFSYELIDKDYDNERGDNWVQSCTVYGTPGSDPKPTCGAPCTATSCGPFECRSDGQCDCTLFGIFYPSCNGGSCRQCKLTPMVPECNVTWIVNETANVNAALFEWQAIDMDLEHGYKLFYFSADGSTKNVVFSGSELETLRYMVSDYNPREYQVGGYIITLLNIDGVDYNSDSTFCHIVNPITPTPSVSPTTSPTAVTQSPTERPSEGERACCNCLRLDSDRGCIDAQCEAFVCNMDAFCCEHRWDQICAIRSYAICTDQAVPGCCECATSPDVGCNNFECLHQVCRDDPYCCGKDGEGYWDSFCVSQALDICQSIVV